MNVAALTQNQVDQPAGANSAFSELGSSDFFKLIITDLLNQDPLEPTDNEQLLRQIASIRELEVNQEITTSLRALLDQQQMGSAVNFIGSFAHSADGISGGLVTGVRFDANDLAILRLADGSDLPMSNVTMISSAEQYANSLIGQYVVAAVPGADQSAVLEGVVTGVKNESGRLMLELDTGQKVALADVRQQRSVSA